MKPFVREEIRALAGNTSKPCLSLYMYTHRGGMESRQDPIRFRNLLAQARESLIAGGMRSAEARKFLSPVAEILDDPQWWRNSADGLAVFRSPQLFHSYRLPITVEEMVTVGDRFIVSPLLRVYSRDRAFNVLSLNLKKVQLFHCTQDGIAEVTMEGVPASFDDFLKIYGLEESSRYRTMSVSKGGRTLGVTASHGGVVDESPRKRYIQQFFIDVDRVVQKHLAKEENLPLMLAGVKYLCSLYREVNSYRGLVGQEVAGSTMLSNSNELHAKALAAIEPFFELSQQVAIAKYKELAGTPMASSELEKIMPAACNGQVRTLLLQQGAHTWGTYDPVTQKVNIQPGRAEGREDLLDLVASNTLLHGGDIYTVGEESTGGTVAAVFRY